MRPSTALVLKEHGIAPSAQRLAVAECVLYTEAHPSADEVWAEAKGLLPMISRATVYNTLNLFVRRGILGKLVLSEGRVLYDPKRERHHHFVDEVTGRVEDVPWSAVALPEVVGLAGYEVRECMVVMRGRKLGGPRSPRARPEVRSSRRAHRSRS